MAHVPANPQLTVDGYWGVATTRALCDYFDISSGRNGDFIVRGQYQPNIDANPGLVASAWVDDGTLAGDDVIRKLQGFNAGLTKDGILGTNTIKTIQDIVGLPAKYQDGVLDAPSNTIKSLQTMLNNGSLLR